MKFSRVLPWRLHVWFATHQSFLRRLGWTLTAAVVLVSMGFLVTSITHTTVLAQSDNIPEEATDIPASSLQNVRGVVDSTHIKAKKHEAPRQAKHSEVLLGSPSVLSSRRINAQIPILMYHKTPANFEAQLHTLEAKGYTTIHMHELERIMQGETVGPTKPVVITFDDGFANQMSAYEQLQKHNMKATFYVIVGGQLSQGCLGLERSRLDCGDDYLNWEQVKALAESDLVEIGSHTFDHPDLPTLSTAEQLHQISASKRYIEQKLGREITTFAYPYGKFNPSIAQLVQNAGYQSAVTTIGGIEQSSNALYELRRVRDASILP